MYMAMSLNYRGTVKAKEANRTVYNLRRTVKPTQAKQNN